MSTEWSFLMYLADDNSLRDTAKDDIDKLSKADPDDALLSRMPLKRMSAEFLYDTLVMISGKLDETRFGPPEPVEVRDDGLVTPIGTDMGWRRSIYVAQRRTEVACRDQKQALRVAKYDGRPTA